MVKMKFYNYTKVNIVLLLVATYIILFVCLNNTNTRLERIEHKVDTILTGEDVKEAQE